MYIAMNRFKVQNGSETAFEDVWKNRDSSLSEMKGFRELAGDPRVMWQLSRGRPWPLLRMRVRQWLRRLRGRSSTGK